MHKLAELQNIPLEQQRGAFLELVKNNVDGIATHLGAVMGTNLQALDKIWLPLGGDINVLKATIIEGSKNTPHISGPEEEIGKKKFNLANFLHGASGILHAIAPIANAIIPGAGLALGGLGKQS